MNVPWTYFVQLRYFAFKRIFSPESVKLFGPKPGQGIKIQVKEAECKEVLLRTNNLNAPNAVKLN